ncbi:hypothetical protein XarjCFBP1022_03075 [Xanthomonas arboricola]|nr:hypothetical protein XarjCFBP1022_03075 [Xanthomonas arboricola]PPU45752.1 hypothetical protein XarbCFBP7697_08070 [Xanthomonas arboricola]
MPRKSLQGRTCGVSRDGGRARAPQPSGRSPALQLSYPQRRRSSTLPCGVCCDGGGQGPCSKAADRFPYS